MASATLINSTSTSASLNGSSLNSLTSDNCVSNNLCNHASLTNLSINYNNSTTNLHDHPTRSKVITLPDINNNNSNSSNTISQTDLSSNTTANTLTSNDHSTNRIANNLNSLNNVNNFITNSPEMIKVKQCASLSNSISNSPQDYPTKKSGSLAKSYLDTNLYSEIAMDVKVINSDCIIYTYCSDVNIAIEDHFKKALNTNIFTKHKGK